MPTALNTLAHKLTPQQEQELLDMGIHQVDVLPEDISKQLKDIKIDTDIINLADELVSLVEKYDYVLLPCGNPSFAFVFANIFTRKECKTIPLFAHSDRQSVERQVVKRLQVVENGEVTEKDVKIVEKQSIFIHVKWMSPYFN